MGIFFNTEKAIQPKDLVFENSTEAFVALVYAAATADGIISSNEWNQIAGMLALNPMFKGYDMLDLYQSVSDKSKKAGGAVNLAPTAAGMLDEFQKQKAFVFCVDMVLADGHQHEKELVLLAELKELLAIPAELAEATLLVMKVKNGYTD